MVSLYFRNTHLPYANWVHGCSLAPWALTSCWKHPSEDPATTESVKSKGANKKHHKHKGKSKTRSKRAGAASSTLEASPRSATRTPRVNVALAKQVAQDLHLSLEGSDSENLEEANKDTQGTPNLWWIRPRQNPGLIRQEHLPHMRQQWAYLQIKLRREQ